MLSRPLTLVACGARFLRWQAMRSQSLPWRGSSSASQAARWRSALSLSLAASLATKDSMLGFWLDGAAAAAAGAATAAGVERAAAVGVVLLGIDFPVAR